MIDLVVGLAAIAWMVVCTWRLARSATAQTRPAEPAGTGQGRAPRCHAPRARHRRETTAPAPTALAGATPEPGWAAYEAPAYRRLGRSPDLRARW